MLPRFLGQFLPEPGYQLLSRGLRLRQRNHANVYSDSSVGFVGYPDAFSNTNADRFYLPNRYRYGHGNSGQGSDFNGHCHRDAYSEADAEWELLCRS